MGNGQFKQSKARPLLSYIYHNKDNIKLRDKDSCHICTPIKIAYQPCRHQFLKVIEEFNSRDELGMTERDRLCLDLSIRVVFECYQKDNVTYVTEARFIKDVEKKYKNLITIFD